MSERFPLNLPRNSPNDDVYANCIRGYLQEIRTLKSQVEQLKKKNNELSSANIAFEAQNSSMTAKVNSADVSKQKLLTQLSELRVKYERASKEITNLSETNQDLNSKLAVEKNRSNELSIKTAQDTEKNLSQQSQIVQLQEQVENLKVQNRSLQTEVDELRKTKEENTSALQVRNTCLSEQKSIINELNKKLEKYQKENLQLKSTLKSNQRLLSDTEHMTTVLQKRVDEIEQSARDDAHGHIEEAAHLTQHIQELEDELDDANDTIEELRSQIDKLKIVEDKLKKSDQQKRALAASLHALHEKSKQKSDLIELLKSESEQTKASLLDQLSQAEQKQKEAEEKLAQNDEEVKSIRNQLAETRAQFTETLSLNQSTHQQQVDFLSEKLGKTQSLCKELAHQLGGSPTKQQVHLLNGRIRTLEEANETLKRSMVGDSTEAFAARQKVSELETENIRLQTQLQRAKEKIKQYKNLSLELQRSERKATSLLEQTLIAMDQRDSRLARSVPGDSPIKSSPIKSSPRIPSYSPSKTVDELKRENLELLDQIDGMRSESDFIRDLRAKIDFDSPVDSEPTETYF